MLINEFDFVKNSGMDKFVEVTKLFQMEKPQVTDKSSRRIFLNMTTEQLIEFDLYKCKSMHIVTKNKTHFTFTWGLNS